MTANTLSNPPMLREFAAKHDLTGELSRPRVLLAYEDFAMGLRGMDLFASIAKAAGVEADAQVSLWRFDFFEGAEWRETFARRAQDVEIVIVALRRGHNLPPKVSSWMERWARFRKENHGALVVIFDADPLKEPGHADSKAAVRLRGVARSAGLDFFCSEPAESWDPDLVFVSAEAGSRMGISPVPAGAAFSE